MITWPKLSVPAAARTDKWGTTDGQIVSGMVRDTWWTGPAVEGRAWPHVPILSGDQRPALPGWRQRPSRAGVARGKRTGPVSTWPVRDAAEPAYRSPPRWLSVRCPSVVRAPAYTLGVTLSPALPGRSVGGSRA